MSVWQDGDGEGVLKLDRLPTAEEAVTIRARIGLRKKKEYSIEQREKLAEHMRKIRFEAQVNRAASRAN
jgi:hypothetical protein